MGSVTKVALRRRWQTVGDVRVGGRDIQESSVLSTQWCCEPQTAPRSSLFFKKHAGALPMLKSPGGFQAHWRGTAVWGSPRWLRPEHHFQFLPLAVPVHLRLSVPGAHSCVPCASRTASQLLPSLVPQAPHPAPFLHSGSGAVWGLFPFIPFFLGSYHVLGTDPGAGTTQRMAK